MQSDENQWNLEARVEKGCQPCLLLCSQKTPKNHQMGSLGSWIVVQVHFGDGLGLKAPKIRDSFTEA